MPDAVAPHLARQYLAWLQKKPYGPRVMATIGFDDALQWIWLAWCETGRPATFSYETLRQGWLHIYKHYYREVRPGHTVDAATIAEPAAVQHPFIRQVLDHYEHHTATETIAHFGLPDNARVRRWLGRCLPKPGRGTGKQYGDRLMRVPVTGTYQELLAAGVPRVTAWRAVKRGWYGQKEGADRNRPQGIVPRP